MDEYFLPKDEERILERVADLLQQDLGQIITDPKDWELEKYGITREVWNGIKENINSRYSPEKLVELKKKKSSSSF